MSLPAVPAGMPGKATVKRILSPDEWRKKQLDTLRAVGEANYKIGIASPKKDPIAAGIAAEDKWADRVRKAIEEQLSILFVRFLLELDEKTKYEIASFNSLCEILEKMIKC